MDSFVSMNCNDLGEIVVHCGGCISNTACIWLAFGLHLARIDILFGSDFSCMFL